MYTYILIQDEICVLLLQRLCLKHSDSVTIDNTTKKKNKTNNSRVFEINAQT